MQTQGKHVALAGLTTGFSDGLDVPDAQVLIAFAQAVVQRDDDRAAVAREALLRSCGEAGLVDAAATVAAFHGFVRVADTIGIPHFSPGPGADLAALRQEAGIEAFPRMSG